MIFTASYAIRNIFYLAVEYGLVQWDYLLMFKKVVKSINISAKVPVRKKHERVLLLKSHLKLKKIDTLGKLTTVCAFSKKAHLA